MEHPRKKRIRHSRLSIYISRQKGEESEGSEVSPDGDGEGWSLCIILGKDRSMERHGGVQACPGWDGDD